MRLFISINFDQPTRANILKVQERLRREGNGNFSSEENLHLTLAFLGEIDEERVSAVKEAMDTVYVPELNLRFSDIGFFRTGKNQDSQLWWIGLEENKLLSKLQAGLTKELKARGFVLEDRAFKPHITLARELHLYKWDKQALFPKKFTATAEHISLMRSHRVNGKLTYTEIYRK